MRSELGGACHARQDQHLLSLVVVRMHAAPAFSRISFTLPRRQKTKQQSASLFVVTESSGGIGLFFVSRVNKGVQGVMDDVQKRQGPLISLALRTTPPLSSRFQHDA